MTVLCRIPHRYLSKNESIPSNRFQDERLYLMRKHDLPPCWKRCMCVFIFASMIICSTSAVAQKGTESSALGDQWSHSDRLPGLDKRIIEFEGLSAEDKAAKFESLSDDQKAAVFENLSDSDREIVFKALSHADKVWIFENLSDDDKVRVFDRLDNDEKSGLFASLGDNEKRKVFNRLREPDKQMVFAGLNEVDQRRLFRNLTDLDKKSIISVLTKKEKESWLQRYPELEKLFLAEELAPRPTKMVETPSDIEKIMSGQFPSEISRELAQYGYDFFNKDISTFSPINNVPVGSDYVIGPGDSFTVHLWGKAEKNYEVKVTRDGKIVVPRLGTVNVSGLTFEELKHHLYRKFREYYPDFDMSITMGTLRTVDIFVVGEANNPGTYSVNALSSVITALFAAGGPSKNGSLRNISLIRNGSAPKILDLYEFFSRGKKKQDVRLQPGDTIFIPVLGPVVGISGCVKRPAIYELKGGETIGDIIALGGGILPLGYLQNVVLERVKGHQRRVIKSFNLDPSHDKANKNLGEPLQDFDLIRIYPVHKRLRQVVYLEGHVKYPREYELKPGMRLSDLIPSYDYLLPEPYLPQGEVIRLMPPDLHPEILAFNLGELMDGKGNQNIMLQDMDRVVVYDAWEKREKPEVTIKGAVRYPGTYRLYKGMTLKDLIFKAGNLTDKAFLDRANLTRIITSQDNTDTLKLEFSPRHAMAGLSKENLALKKNDAVYIREIPKYRQALERKVYLEGAFLFPGEYAFSEGERLNSVIERAGGLTDEAYPFGAVFRRESVRKIQRERLKEYINKLEQDILTMGALSTETALDKEQAAILKQTISAKQQLLEKMRTAESTGRMVINLEEVLVLPSSDYNFELRPGDHLTVARRPDSVNVLGEVYNPTALLSEKGKTVEYYLNRVGGVTDNAEKSQIYVVKANGTVISKSQSGWLGMATWDSENYRWSTGGFKSVKLDPGDTVIVPKKVEKYPWLRIVKDVTQVMYQIAVAAGVIIVAF